MVLKGVSTEPANTLVHIYMKKVKLVLKSLQSVIMYTFLYSTHEWQFTTESNDDNDNSELMSHLCEVYNQSTLQCTHFKVMVKCVILLNLSMAERR